MTIKNAEGSKPDKKTDVEELMYSLLYLYNRKLPWTDIKGKTHVDICRKMNVIKKTIKLENLFKNLPNELLLIYKNLMRLNLYEEPEYDLYSILFENVLRRKNKIDNKSFVFCYSEKINDYILNTYNKKRKGNSESTIELIFKGYPLNYINKKADISS
jgi:hypothetical protein